MNWDTKKRRGFTLIELLVVIAIIGILAGLIMAAVSASIKKGRETRGSVEARQIALAWENYLREYATWPAGFGGTEGSAFDLAENCTNLLAGADEPGGANPKRIVFFAGKDKPLKDPWKQSYRFMLDLNYDGKITMPAAQGGAVVPRSVIVWSVGSDLLDTSESTRQDDRCSWK